MKTMKNRMVLKWTAAGMLSVSVMFASAQAQTTLSGDHIVTGNLNVGTSGSTGNLTVTAGGGYSGAPALKVIGNDGVLFTGSFGGGEIPVEGAGTRMMWFPGQGAFRAGTVTNSGYWDAGYVGNYSVAFGLDTYAWEYSMAAGNNAQAYSSYSLAFGNNSWVGGNYSMVFGNNSSAGNGTYSLAFGNGSAVSSNYALAFGSTYVDNASDYSVAIGAVGGVSGAYSLAFGNSSHIYGDYSLGFGNDVYLGSDYSFSFGLSTTNFGEYSLAFGNTSQAMAPYSVAIGDHVSAEAYGTFAIGRNNVGGFDAGDDGDTTWVETDPIFEIGIGTGDDGDPAELQKRNALTVYKNGKIKMERQGDILMGEFGE